MNKYRIAPSTDSKGQTLWAVEELNEQNEWATIKVFTTRQAAEDEKQTLEAYGKENKK